MANALTDFTKKREFLVCMDSDGCVMNTVRIKHTTVMCPELIRVFALDEQADFITAAWDEINLHTITRGISRFESVRLVFDRLKNRGIEIPGSEVGRPAKIITQSPHNIERLEIFGQQDYIKTSKPESMSGKEIYRWVDWERENMN